MAKNAKFKLDGTQYDFEKDASVVTYGEGKLNTALNGLQEVRTTGFGRQLLSADEEDFRRLLEISKEDIWDEVQNRWNGGARRSSTQKKFGTYSLYVGTSNLYTDVVFGGQPFTISFWAYFNSVLYDTHMFRAIGLNRSFAYYFSPLGSSFYAVYTGTTSPTTHQLSAVRPDTKTWHHFELDYNGSTMYSFCDGAKMTSTYSFSITVPREVRRIYLGSFAGYVDSFRILDGKCLHTAAFTAPSSAYKFESYPDETISLLNFE